MKDETVLFNTLSRHISNHLKDDDTRTTINRLLQENNNALIDTCCNEPQKAFAFFYLLYILLIYLTWNTSIVKPMRLITVFVHEMSHAIACWITCGSVRKIEVNHREGGVTRFVGGCRCCIIPAGYLGASFWAMVFVTMSGGRKTSTVTAVGFILALLVALCYSPNSLMVFLNVGYALITLVFLYVEWFWFSPILAYVILYYGVFMGIYAITDIYNDCVYRTVQGSDAYALYEEVPIPCCFPKCVGLQWLFIAIGFQCIGIWMALVLMSDECEDRAWMECVFSDAPLWMGPDFFEHMDWIDGARWGNG